MSEFHSDISNSHEESDRKVRLLENKLTVLKLQLGHYGKKVSQLEDQLAQAVQIIEIQRNVIQKAGLKVTM
jgi:hypothetical protein